MRKSATVAAQATITLLFACLLMVGCADPLSRIRSAVVAAEGAGARDTATSGSNPDAKPTVLAAEAAVLAIARSEKSSVPIVSAQVVGIGRDSRGLWWVQAWTLSKRPWESEQWFVTFNGKRWALVDFGKSEDRLDHPSDIKWQDTH